MMETFNFNLQIYIPFFSDYGFKVTFGNERNTLFLRQSLQALIASEIPIEEVWFDKNTLEGATLESRGGVLDLYCRNEKGDIFIVEMQLGLFRNIIQRLRFYGHTKLDVHIKKGKHSFADLPKVYCIGILGFNLYPDDDYHRTGFLRDDKGRILDENHLFSIVELDKFTKKPEDCVTDLDKLIFTMKEAHNIALNTPAPAFMKESWIASALEELDTRGLSPERRADLRIALAKELSERYRLEHLEEEAIIHGLNLGIKKGMEKGLKEGLKEGKEVGLKEGIKEGIKKGIKEGLKEGMEISNKKAIRNLMLNMPDLNNEDIARLLQLEITLVEEVRNEIQKGGDD